MSDFPLRDFALHGFVLREAQENDLDAIVAVDGASFSQPWQPHTFAQSLQDEKTRVCVVEKNREICGFGVASVVCDEGEIATLAVAQHARGDGLGARILNDLIDWCASRNAARVFLEVRESNASAQRLYKRLGFATVGARPNYYADGETALLMKKTFE